jgi:hypothetical protein
MTHIPNASEPAAPPLADLLAQYLQRQVSAWADGLGSGDTTAEIVPFEAAPVQPVDSRLAWDGATATARFFQAQATPRSWQAPADWPALVTAHEPAAALAFSFGNFPQLVRNLHPLWQASDLSALRPAGARPVPAPMLEDWAAGVVSKQVYPQVLIAAGVLRLARHFDAAAAILQQQQRPHVPAEWQPAWSNEEAALAWHQGRAEEAAALWRSQPDSVPVLFNRGMAALFLAQPAEARVELSQAVNQLPETNAWHHLGRLYLALAEMHG